MKSKADQYRSIWLPIFVASISGLAIQAGAGLIWGGKLISRVDQIDQRNTEQDKLLERINTRGTEQLPLVELRLKTGEEVTRATSLRIDNLQQQMNVISPIIQAQFDSIKQNLARIEEIQRRTAESIETLQRKIK